MVVSAQTTIVADITNAGHKLKPKVALYHFSILRQYVVYILVGHTRCIPFFKFVDKYFITHYQTSNSRTHNARLTGLIFDGGFCAASCTKDDSGNLSGAADCYAFPRLKISSRAWFTRALAKTKGKEILCFSQRDSDNSSASSTAQRKNAEAACLSLLCATDSGTAT